MSDDYIKREDVKEWLTNLREDCGRYQDLWHYAEALEQIIELLDADVAPIRRGHWIYDRCDIVCSECGTRYNDELCYMLRSDCSYNEPRYCPWCGARMDGGKDDD